MKTFAFCLFSIILCLSLTAEPLDSLVKFSELVFRNENERTAFRNYHLQGEKADIVDLFMTHHTKNESYSSVSAHKLISEAVAELKKETSGLNDQKRVKYIYSYIHKRFFTVYQLNNSFPDIFENGRYNCVSGSAMYAIIFHAMGIPYQVVEAPQHVFLFAYPQTHKLMIETTAPKNGYVNFSEAYVQRFVNYMKESKLISREEAESTPAGALFDKYYFSEKGLTVQELAAIQYANYAYYYHESQEDEKALQEAKKAYFISPNEKNLYILKTALLMVVSNKSYKEKKDIDNLVLLTRFNNRSKNEISDESLRQEFHRMTYEQLINNSNYEAFEQAFARVHASVRDSSVRKEIDFAYHYELARLGLTNGKGREYEFGHLKGAYQINPKHADLRLIIKSYLSRLIESTNESGKIMKDMETFETSFGFLTDDESFNTVKANCYLELAYQFFTLQNPVKGDLEIARFEAVRARHTGLKATESFIERAYSSAAAYYFKKGNKPKTREYLKRGLSHAPDNFGLQLRLSQVH